MGIGIKELLRGASSLGRSIKRLNIANLFAARKRGSSGKLPRQRNRSKKASVRRLGALCYTGPASFEC